MAGSLKLSRSQLTAFLKDHESIKQFERLFAIVDPLQDDQVAAVGVAADNAASRAQEALDALNRMANALEFLAMAPESTDSLSDQIIVPPVETQQETQISPQLTIYQPPDDLAPVVPLGTLGMQQSDRVDITGGTVSAQLKNNQTILLETTNTLSDGAAAAAGTLLNSPVAGNPTKWVAINDNGVTRYIPTW